MTRQRKKTVLALPAPHSCCSASSSAVAVRLSLSLAPRAVVHGRRTSEDDRVTVALEKAITTCPPLRLSRSRWPATASLDQLNSITVTQRPKIKDHTGYGSRATPKQGFAVGEGKKKREKRRGDRLSRAQLNRVTCLASLPPSLRACKCSAPLPSIKPPPQNECDTTVRREILGANGNCRIVIGGSQPFLLYEYRDGFLPVRVRLL